MASATPVVGSSLSAGPEVVPHVEAGLTVDRNDLGAISGAVAALMTNPRLREQFEQMAAALRWSGITCGPY